nr:16S rRNA (guanine(527)-N(7))-methyltransferase RsmG [Feifania hominis]
MKQGLDGFGIEADEEQLAGLWTIAERLIEKNRVMNLTAITEPAEVVEKHLLDSASLLGEGLIGPQMRVIDVGCGAGFPGLPLAVLRPESFFVLLDATRKKLHHIDEVAGELRLFNLETIHARAEELGANPSFREQYDVATARAVAALPKLCELCLPFVRVGGMFLAMKGAGAADEVKDAANAIQTLGGELEEIKQIAIKGSDLTHCIIVIRKKSRTPQKYPRIGAQMAKNPL